jgi:hypothetical protein
MISCAKRFACGTHDPTFELEEMPGTRAEGAPLAYDQGHCRPDRLSGIISTTMPETPHKKAQVKSYQLEATQSADLDVEATFDWYEGEEPGLGSEFLDELRVTYQRIMDHPLGRLGIRL